MDKLENGSTNLRTKPTARLCFSFVPQPKDKATSPERILVFLSGLDNPKTVWQRLLDQLVEQSRRNGIVLPPMLLYDRFGVGQSDPDPTDAGKRPEEYHDANDAVDDLHELIAQIVEQKLGHNKNPVDNLGIVFCAHSFGVCIARLYAQRFPGTTEGLLLMDSAIANTPAEKFTPNPDDPVEWDEAQKWLPETITADMCRDAIRKTLASPVSGYTMTTRERMRWTNMPELLPYSDRPKLQGPRPELPLVTVMSHDSDASGPKMSKVSSIGFVNVSLIRLKFTVRP